MTNPIALIPPLVAGLTNDRQWPTYIFRASDGTENRTALMGATQGLRGMGFDSKGVKSGDGERILAAFKSADGLAWLPFWSLASRLSAATTGSAVAVLSVAYGVYDGATVALVSPDGRKGTIHTVSNVSGSDITLDPAPVASEYPAGSWLAPAMLAFAGSFSRSHTFDFAPLGQFSFTELSPAPVEAGASLPTTYLGHWVFGQGSGWEDILPRGSVVASGRNRAAMVGASFQRVTRTIEEPTEFDVSLSLSIRSPDETSLIWRMQDALGGQLSGLWVRSYIADASPLSIDGAVVSVVDKGQRAIFEGRHLWDRKNSTGHHVVSVADGDTGEIDITLDPAPAADAGPLELLFFCRLAADTIGMQANTDNVQRWDCSITLRELPSETPEPEE